MINVTVTKKIISAMLLGSLLVTGAVVYADTVSDTESVRGLRGPAGTEQRVEKQAEMLSQLVSDGVITADEKAALEKAMETQKAAMEARREALKNGADSEKTAPADREKPEAGTKPPSHFARMAEEGLISDALADKLDAYMEAQRTAAFAESVKPLVDAGTFDDTDEVKAALTAVREAMQAQREELKPAVLRDKADYKNLTDEERTALKEKMEAERTAMQEKHSAAVKEVFSDLVDAGTLTQAQADALQAHMNSRESGMKVRGPGVGGMGRGGASLNSSPVTAQ